MASYRFPESQFSEEFFTVFHLYPVCTANG